MACIGLPQKCTAILLSVLLSESVIAAESMTDCVRIRQIQITTQEVYPEAEDPNWLESTLNTLNFRTRQEVVREELLVREGDCHDPKLVAETGRNLRALGIFTDARVETIPVPESQQVDLHVFARDRFTFRGEVSVSQNAGRRKERVSLGDANVLGLNQRAYVSYEKEGDETETAFNYYNPRIWDHYALGTSYERARDGGLQQYRLERPFRALSDRFAWGGSYLYDNQNLEYSLDGGDSLFIPQKEESTAVYFSRELGTRERSRRASVNLAHTHQRYDLDDPDINNTLAGLPGTQFNPALHTLDLDLGMSWTQRKGYRVLTGVDSLIYREDIAHFTSWGFSFGLQFRDDAQLNWAPHPKLGISYQATKFFSQRSFASRYLRTGWRFYGSRLKAFETQAYYRYYYLPSERQAWVVSLSGAYEQARDELSEPLTMGGEFGLRGFEQESFTGNKTLLLNLEHRLRLPSPSQNIGLGQALFIDSGYAWKRGRHIRGADLQTSIGWGLRVDVPSLFGSNILRFDVAVPPDTGEPLYTITLGQVFRYNEAITR